MSTQDPALNILIKLSELMAGNPNPMEVSAALNKLSATELIAFQGMLGARLSTKIENARAGRIDITTI
jgi:hypothetical protein